MPVLAKILESFVHEQVYRYLAKHCILHDAQSGFRPKHCTQDALLKTINEWRMGLEKNKIIGAAFVDLSKAFDSVCHVTLLKKLSLYGFRGGSLRWFRSYLQGRKQRVAYGGEVSGWSDVCSGVPQGSILGPLLFASL